VKFLVDQNLSPEVATHLSEAGHDAIHVRDRAMQRATDEAVLAFARLEGRVLISADTDSGLLLGRSGDTGPSFILLRRASERRATQQVRLILGNLDEVLDELEAGSIVVLADENVRIRRLPLPPA
jgi:predicted nuclease of predicted toxin-antitoxin system